MCSCVNLLNLNYLCFVVLSCLLFHRFVLCAPYICVYNFFLSLPFAVSTCWQHLLKIPSTIRRREIIFSFIYILTKNRRPFHIFTVCAWCFFLSLIFSLSFAFNESTQITHRNYQEKEQAKMPAKKKLSTRWRREEQQQEKKWIQLKIRQKGTHRTINRFDAIFAEYY